MALNREKFRAVVHYICWRCTEDPSRLGATKLNKVLWLSDFLRYYKAGETITGGRYVKRQYGPVPSAIVPTLKDLESEGSLIIKDVDFHGRLKKEFVALQEPDLSSLEAEELALVDSIITFVCDTHTAAEISEKSHDHIWHAAEEGEELPPFTIFSKPGDITDDEREWAYAELGDARS